MSKRNTITFFVSAFYLMVSHHELYSQTKRWDGEAGDSLWSNAVNWEDNNLPSASSDVLLDNSLMAEAYVVKFSSGTSAITVRSLEVTPGESRSITVLIPSENKAVPALSATAFPGIRLGTGAVLINASGAASGNAVAVSDSLRILNGGRFIQRSETAHATLVGRLAQSGGTENGIFEFDVPGGASYTVSISNRVYGTVIFRAAAAGGQKNYLSSGSGPLLVRGDFVIGAGAIWALNYSGICTIAGNAKIEGSWNLSSGIHSNTVKLLGDFECKGKVLESGTGNPLLEWGGAQTQHISVPGILQNDIGVHMNNPQGVQLQSSITVKRKMILSRGIVFSALDRMLVLDTACILQADSLAGNVFVHGPIRRKGILAHQSVRFPVGKGNTQRWLSLQDFTGDVTVEFMKEDPAILSSLKGEGISHISAIEYWKIAAANTTSGKVELSFDQVNSGGVSDLSALRVAGLVEGKWMNMGNIFVTGTAGSNGSVISQEIASIQSQGSYFTLASASSGVNTLPDDRIELRIIGRENGGSVEGLVTSTRRFTQWKIEAVQGDSAVKPIYHLQDPNGAERFSFHYSPPSDEKILYRACAFTDKENTACSKWVLHQLRPAVLPSFQLYPNPVRGRLRVSFHPLEPGKISFYLIGIDGRVHHQYHTDAKKGSNTFQLDLSGIGRGNYWLQCIFNGNAVRSRMVQVN